MSAFTSINTSETASGQSLKVDGPATSYQLPAASLDDLHDTTLEKLLERWWAVPLVQLVGKIPNRIKNHGGRTEPGRGDRRSTASSDGQPDVPRPTLLLQGIHGSSMESSQAGQTGWAGEPGQRR